MANCLEIAFKHNIPKQQRKARVAKSPDWQIMDKSWRSILTIALDEVEIPGDDEDNSTSRSSRMMRRRGRGSSAGKSSLDWLPSSEEISADSSETAAYRLAVLLITKVASYRIVLGTFVGMILMSSLLNIVGSDSNPMFAIPLSLIHI